MTLIGGGGLTRSPPLERRTEWKKMSKKKSNYISEPFIYIPRRILKSEAYAALTGNAVKVLTLILYRYNGRNNGFIQFSLRDTLLPLQTGKRSLLDLQDKGLIDCAKAGTYRGNVSEWRVTFLKDDRTGQRASDEWKEYPNNPKTDVLKARLKTKAARKNNSENNVETKEANDNMPAQNSVIQEPTAQSNGADANALLKSLENLKRKQGVS